MTINAMWCYRRLFCYLSAFGNSQANDLVTEYLLKTVISCVKYIVREKRFHLFLNRLRLLYSIPKSFALLLAFHVSRHTFATLSLALGIDLYTVCKLLGHKNIISTQVYAKIIDASKRQAIDRFNGVLDAWDGYYFRFVWHGSRKILLPKIRVIRYSFSPQLAYQIRDFVLFPTKAPCIPVRHWWNPSPLAYLQTQPWSRHPTWCSRNVP